MKREVMVTLEVEERARPDEEAGGPRVVTRDKGAYGAKPIRVNPVWLASRVKVEGRRMGPLICTSLR